MDPLAPLIFAVAIHPLVQEISKECPNLEANIWYLDDGEIAGSTVDVLRALNILMRNGPPLGLFLGASKCELIRHREAPQFENRANPSASSNARVADERKDGTPAFVDLTTFPPEFKRIYVERDGG